jgi:hypothetical protein
MFRMNWLLHPAYSFFASIALFYLFLLNACGREDVRTTNYVATISVNGHDYAADVVGQMKFSILNNGHMPSPYGHVMTFRLQDDRVIVLDARKLGHVLKCVPRLDQSDSGCEKRWPYKNSHLRPDGYVFNSATDPTSAEAFQFHPRNPEFVAKGRYDLLQSRRIPLSIPVSDLLIEMVSYAQTASQERRPRDTLDRDFPGYDLTRFRDGKRVSDTNAALNQAADHAGVPLARHRR